MLHAAQKSNPHSRIIENRKSFSNTHKTQSYFALAFAVCAFSLLLLFTRFVNFLSSVSEFKLFTSLAPQHTHACTHWTNKTAQTEIADARTEHVSRTRIYERTRVRVMFDYLFVLSFYSFFRFHSIQFALRCWLFSYIWADSVRARPLSKNYLLFPMDIFNTPASVIRA